jgi:hypothetical protein
VKAGAPASQHLDLRGQDAYDVGFWPDMVDQLHELGIDVNHFLGTITQNFPELSTDFGDRCIRLLV